MTAPYNQLCQMIHAVDRPMWTYITPCISRHNRNKLWNLFSSNGMYTAHRDVFMKIESCTSK